MRHGTISKSSVDGKIDKIDSSNKRVKSKVCFPGMFKNGPNESSAVGDVALISLATR